MAVTSAGWKRSPIASRTWRYSTQAGHTSTQAGHTSTVCSTGSGGPQCGDTWGFHPAECETAVSGEDLRQSERKDTVASLQAILKQGPYRCDCGMSKAFMYLPVSFISILWKQNIVDVSRLDCGESLYAGANIHPHKGTSSQTFTYNLA